MKEFNKSQASHKRLWNSWGDKARATIFKNKYIVNHTMSAYHEEVYKTQQLQQRVLTRYEKRTIFNKIKKHHE